MTLGRVKTFLVTLGITRLEHLHCGYNLQHDTLAKLFMQMATFLRDCVSD